MLIHDYYSTGQAIAASTITTFNSTMIPSTNLCSLSFAFTGANNTLANLNRIRVKANGQTIVDTTPAFLRAHIQRMTEGRVSYPSGQALDALGVAGTPLDWRRITIPLLDLRQMGEARERSQFPRGANITVELAWAAGAGAGSAFVAWAQSNLQAEVYPKLISQAMNCNVSQVNFRYAFADEGTVCGFGLNTVGLSRARLVLSGAQVFHTAGGSTANNTNDIDNLFVEAQQLYNRTPEMAAATAGVPVTFYDPLVHRVDTGIPAASGNSYIELGTGTNWGGAAPTSNELFIYSEVRQ